MRFNLKKIKQNIIMKKSQFLKSAVLTLFIGGFMASCVQTETIDEPREQETPSEDITLVLNAPADACETRAEDGYVLRYVVMLFEYNKNSSTNTLRERKEILENIDKSQNEIIFKGEVGKVYNVYCFADYIPAGSQQNSQGLYKDYFYDTNSSNEEVTIITDPKSGNSKKMAPEFFNNDYYDCFAISYVEKKKEETKMVLNSPLQRITARIRFVDDNLSADNFKSVTISSLGYKERYSHMYGSVFSHNGSVKPDGAEFTTPGNIGEKEIFYFYTLAQKGKEDMPVANYSFTTINAEDFSLTTTLTSNKPIPFQRNYVTTVKGKFLSTETASQGPGDTDKEPEDTGNGDIVVSLDTEKNWADPEITYDPQ